eukprot:jgi/Psemu1/288341/fgenesh1_pg.254_\
MTRSKQMAGRLMMFATIEITSDIWNAFCLVFIPAIVCCFCHLRLRRNHSTKHHDKDITDNFARDLDFSFNEYARTGGVGWIRNDPLLPAEGIFGDGLYRNGYGNDYDDHGTVILQQQVVEITFDLGDTEEKIRRFLCRLNRIVI